MAQIDVSVIVPAHNAEKFIARAVHSVQEQKGMSWEILLIENGSADHTYEACLALGKSDASIRVMQSEKGVSRARNLGLDKARGKWICFLDADDYLYPQAFHYLEQAVSRSSCDFYLFGHNSGDKAKEDKKDTVRVYTGDAFLRVRCEMIKDPTRRMTVWGKLFCREIIEENGIRFDEELALNEDGDFTFRYSKFCQSIGEIHAELYHYSRDKGSAVRTYREGITGEYIASLQKMQSGLQDEPTCIRQAFSYNILMHLLVILVHDTFAKENPMPEAEKTRRMEELIKNPLFENAFADIRLKDCVDARMLPLFCMKCHLYGPARLMIKARARK